MLLFKYNIYNVIMKHVIIKRVLKDDIIQ